MAEVSIRELAESVGAPIEFLLMQVHEAGLPQRTGEDAINDSDKAQLLAYLKRRSEKTEVGPASIESPLAIPRRKLSIKRRIINASTGTKVQSTTAVGRKKTVSVEVKKRRVLSRDKQTNDSQVETPSTPVIDPDIEIQMEAKKRDLHEEAKRHKLDIDERLRVERETRERESRIQEEEKRRTKEQKKLSEIKSATTKQAADDAKNTESTALQSTESAKKTITDVPLESEPKAPPITEEKPSKAAVRGEGVEPGRRVAVKEEREQSKRKKQLGLTKPQSSKNKTSVTRKRSQRITTKAISTQHGFEKPTEPIAREIPLPEAITIGELAQKMSVKASEVIKRMMQLGTMATINQVVDQDTASILVEEMGHIAKPINESSLEDKLLQQVEENESELITRAPVVTIMGHVDHGKTSLLDYIRSTRIAAGEAGGITQHIGAYHVQTAHGPLTFLDTPGHAAFTAMRARGAKVTDIVILVVAADDGVMPQTQEAVQHAKAAGVPVVVAVNKVDREDADPNRVMQALSTIDVTPEQWGGDTQFVNISALTGQGVDGLLEAVCLQTELLELVANKEGPGRGVVIESRLERGRGSVATVLVQSGQIKRGDTLLAGQEIGRVRSLINDRGEKVETAGPSIPVEVLGLSSPPGAGDEAFVVFNERKAREIAENRQSKSREQKLARQQATKLENMFSQMASGEISTLNLIIKADVQGSVEALCDALISLSISEAEVSIVSSGTGGITETDANLAIATGAILIGFNVRADTPARRIIEQEGIDLHYFNVIYDVIDTVRQSLSGLLTPETREEIVGIAQVRDVFRARRYGAIAGCMVLEGTVKRNNPIRVLRDNIVVYEGELESLRRFKEDTNEVKSGFECGIGVRNYNDVKEGDQIEVFEKILIERSV